MNKLGSTPMAANSCGPCLSEKDIKKKNEQEIKELKSTLNYLSKNGYDRENFFVMGQLIGRLIMLQGSLK